VSRPAALIAGVDVGGTKIVAGIAARDGRVIASGRLPTPGSGERPVVSAIIQLLRQVFADAKATPDDVVTIGIAVPAAIARASGAVLWAPNVHGWDRETPVASEVAQALSVETSLHYDGHAWVMGEWWLGAARGARDAALIAVGTGIGGGLILDGRLHRGQVGVAGAIGWWVTDYRRAGRDRREPEACPEARRTGMLESVASGPAIGRAAGTDTAEQAFQSARRGDPRALRAVEAAARATGAAAANLASLLDPEVIVLAGGVIAGGGDLLLPVLREVVRNQAQPHIAAGVRIVPAELGDDAPWLGAAKLALDSADEKGDR
jgi:glucokinase